MSKPESFDDQLSRVRQMAEGSPTWDLSPNDCAALKTVVGIALRVREHHEKTKAAAEKRQRERGTDEVTTSLRADERLLEICLKSFWEGGV